MTFFSKTSKGMTLIEMAAVVVVTGIIALGMTMGTWNRYFCRKCPYEAFISGGDDVRMIAATSTIRCYDCQEIKDVVATGGALVGVAQDSP